MSTHGARPVGATGAGTDHHDHDAKRSPAELFCRIVGPVLILVGLLGFLADATFDTGLSGAEDGDGGNNGGALQGDSFLGFEVNGWHNVVHILTGALLLLGIRGKDAIRRHSDKARNVVLAFGVSYLLVTIIGIIDGNDVIGLFPVNAADNVLHIVLSLGAIGAALASKAKAKHDDRATARA